MSQRLKKQVEKMLPGWESWYPSLFDAARDLGLIRARVCAPSSLLLSSRHASIRQSAQDAHREKWGGLDAHVPARAASGPAKPKARKRRRARK